MSLCSSFRFTFSVPLCGLSIAYSGLAAEHSLTNGDSMGTSSFNTALNWDDGLAPRAGETYVVSGRTLRTPDSVSGNTTFQGDRLTIKSGGSMLLKGLNNSSITIADFVLQGGLNNGVGETGFNIYGNITIPAGSSASCATGSNTEQDRREIMIYAPVSGSGSWSMSVPRPSSGMRAVSLMGNNTAFTGPIYVSGSGKLIITNEIGLGGNPSAYTPIQLALNGSVLRLEGIPETILDDSNRGIWLDCQTNAVQTILPGGKFEIRDSTIATIACLISGKGPLYKIDTGTLVLAATNTYTGATLVQQGLLCVNSATNETASLSVAAGAALGGTGTVWCASTFETNTAIRLAGNGYGTLKLAHPSGIALEKATLSFDLRAPANGVSDSLELSGPLSLLDKNIIAINFPESGLPNGTYTLITYSSLIGDGVVVPSHVYPNMTLTLGANALTLEVTGSGAVHGLNWVGSATNNVWDTTTYNWSPNDALFNQGMNVAFGDGGVASTPVTLAASLAPYNLTVATTNNAYTINTTSSTLFANEIFKYGSAALTLTGTFSVTNMTVGLTNSTGFSAGGAVTLNGKITLTNGNLTVYPSAGTFTQTAGSAINSASNVIIGSDANVYGTNTYAGVTTIGYPTYTKLVTLYSPFALGSTAGETVLRGGTAGGYNKLLLANGITITDEVLTVSGGIGYRAGLWSNPGATACWDGDIKVASDGQLQIGSGAGSTFTIGSIGRTVITNAGTTLSIRDAGTIVLNSRLIMPSFDLNRDDSGLLQINSTNNSVRSINVMQGSVKLNAEDPFKISPPTLLIGKNSDSNNGNKCAFDLNANTLTLSRLIDAHGDAYNGTVDEGRQWILCTKPSTLILNDTSSDSSYTKVGSVMSGPLTFIKAGSRTLTIGHTNALSGAFIVSNGTVIVTATGCLGPVCTNVVVAGGTLTLQNNTALSTAANVFIPSTSGIISIPNGTNVTVSTLWYGEKQRYSGTYGANGSGAQHEDNDHFAGSGILTVLHGSGGTVLRIN